MNQGLGWSWPRTQLLCSSVTGLILAIPMSWPPSCGYRCEPPGPAEPFLYSRQPANHFFLSCTLEFRLFVFFFLPTMERTAYDPYWFLRFPGRAARDEAGMGAGELPLVSGSCGCHGSWPSLGRYWSFLWKSCGQICFCTRVPGAAWKHQDAGIGD